MIRINALLDNLDEVPAWLHCGVLEINLSKTGGWYSSLMPRCERLRYSVCFTRCRW